jgi:flagellar FliJ protein
MSFQYNLQKVLDVKEKEKQSKELAYADAQKRFEESATNLYQALKRKEDIEASYTEKMSTGIAVHQIQQQQNALSHLKSEIDRQTNKTNIARDGMHNKQNDLLNSAMELKKYEKMKEIKRKEYIEEEKRIETKEMDEISLQIYANR